MQDVKSPQGQIELAEGAFRAGADQAALSVFAKLAHDGNPVAQYWLAHMTELGLGTAKDPAKAIDLYKKAADQGNVAAQARLGEIYLEGDIDAPDFQSARVYLDKAAIQGHARAALLLGHIYRLGIGTAADPTEAFAWLEVASLENNALARHERSALLAKLTPQQQETAVERSKALMSAIKTRTGLPASGVSTAAAVNGATPAGAPVGGAAAAGKP